MEQIRIITTEDGSHSLYREDLKETYHSFHGARQESMHVFIQMGLSYFLEKYYQDDRLNTDQPIKVLEIGFGTGLNAYLAALFSRQHQVGIHFETLETIPLPADIYKELNYATGEDKELFEQLHDCEWGRYQNITDSFTLLKHNSPLQTFSADKTFDVVFFDAFAPSKQPELWTKEVMELVYDLTAPKGVFTTYCAKGQLKRDLDDIGFTVTTLPGAPGKKEMVRAEKS